VESTNERHSEAPSRAAGFSRSRLVLLVTLTVLVPTALLAFAISRSHRTSDASPTTPVTDIAPIDHTKARVGHPAPDFSLRGLDGRPVRLSQFRGRPVVLTFFASWCHPCEEELPVLEAARRDSRGRLAVVGVNYQDPEDDTRDFVKQLGVTFPTLIEDSFANPVAARYGVHGIPVTFFLDARGVIATEPMFGQGSRSALQPGLDAILGR